MQKIFKRFLAMTLPVALLILSACGGGGGGEGESGVETTVISGFAVKGPINGALVQVYRLKEDGSRGELLGSANSANDGSYSVQVPTAKAVAPLLVTVSGQAGASYASETTGGAVTFGNGESFNAALDSFHPGRSYTVGPLTEAAYQQLQKFLTLSPSATAEPRVIGAANSRVATLFNVSDLTANPAGDPSYSASLAVIDQMIEDAKSSGTTGSAATMTLINQALADVTKPAYQSYRALLITAANRVVSRTPSLATVVNALLATAARPPAEPQWGDTTAPEPATSLKARAGAESATAGSVELSWNAALPLGRNPVTGYEVYRDGNRIASVSRTSYLDRPLALKTGYRYMVVAFDAAGNRARQSAEVAVATPDAPNLDVNVGGELSPDVTALPFKDITPPSAASNLTAATAAIDATRSLVRLTWSAAIDNVSVSGYEVYRNGVKTGSTAGTSYTDLPVTSGVAHSYTVVALDAAGNRSSFSGALSVTPVAPNLDISVGGGIAGAS